MLAEGVIKFKITRYIQKKTCLQVLETYREYIHSMFCTRFEVELNIWFKAFGNMLRSVIVKPNHLKCFLLKLECTALPFCR